MGIELTNQVLLNVMGNVISSVDLDNVDTISIVKTIEEDGSSTIVFKMDIMETESKEEVHLETGDVISATNF